MTAALESTWPTRELPILQAALRRLDAGDIFPTLEEIRAEVGLDVAQMRAGVDALESASPPYMEVSNAWGNPNHVGGHVSRVSERARRELGTWPSAESVVDRLVAALAEAADAEQESERRTKIRAAAEAVGGFLRDVAVQAVGTQIGGGGPV